MNPKKMSRRCRASVSIQALDLAISRFIHSLGYSISIKVKILFFEVFSCWVLIKLMAKIDVLEQFLQVFVRRSTDFVPARRKVFKSLKNLVSCNSISAAYY
jgi:hypothetical protein